MSAEAAHSPMHQFEIHTLIPLPQLFGYDISFTNSSLFMVIAVGLTMLLFLAGSRQKSMVPGRMQSLAEMLYEFIANTVRDNAGIQGKKYVPFVFAVFMFVVLCNLLGMIPYSFTVTSHIIVTFALAICIFIGVTIIGFIKHGLHFLHLFLPEGSPMWLAPIIIPIELFSYLSRPVSLSIRLAANMMAGHILLKVLAGFVVAMGIFGFIPFSLLTLLIGFELFVALLQAYIFTVLTCVYLNDALNMH